MFLDTFRSLLNAAEDFSEEWVECTKFPLQTNFGRFRTKIIFIFVIDHWFYLKMFLYFYFSSKEILPTSVAAPHQMGHFKKLVNLTIVTI